MMRKGERGGRGGVGRVSRLRYLHGRWKGPSSPTILSGRDDENTATIIPAPGDETRRDESSRCRMIPRSEIVGTNERRTRTHAPAKCPSPHGAI
jgi:hypothetical protein